LTRLFFYEILLSIIGTTAILVEILLFCPKLRLVGSWQRAVGKGQSLSIMVFGVSLDSGISQTENSNDITLPY
jgi:hypothetical protein